MTDTEYPEWYLELKRNNPGPNLNQHIERGTIEEFCGRFDLSKEKAAWEIKRCKLWGFFVSGTFPAQIERFSCAKAPQQLPMQEFERYAAIIAEEREKQEMPPQHPVYYMNKRHLAYSSELEAAVSCWLALFADAPHGKVASHTATKVIDWLGKNRPKLDGTKRKRIATILTPDSRKSGGAPPMPE